MTRQAFGKQRSPNQIGQARSCSHPEKAIVLLCTNSMRVIYSGVRTKCQEVLDSAKQSAVRKVCAPKDIAACLASG